MPKGKRRRHRIWRVSRGTLHGLTTLSLIVGLLGVLFVGQTLLAPGFVRNKIAEKLEEQMGGMGLSFGEIGFILAKGGRPNVTFGDVVITDPAGQDLVKIDRADIPLSMRALLQRQLLPRSVALHGVTGFLERSTAGQLSLSFMIGSDPLRQAPNLPELIATVDDVLQAPLLKGLRRADVDDLSLRYIDRRARQNYLLEGGRVSAVRSQTNLSINGGFSVAGGHSGTSTMEFSFESPIGQERASFGFKVQDFDARDVAGQNAALAWLASLRAPISGAVRGEMTESGALGPLNATLHIGRGVLQPTDATRPIPFRGARSYFTYDPAEGTLRFDELWADTAWGRAEATGEAYLDTTETGWFSSLIGQITMSELSLNPNGIYPEPLDLDGAAADFRLQLDPYRLTLGQLTLADRDSALLLSGEARADPAGWKIALDGRLDTITTDRLIELWPPPLAAKARDWAAVNLEAGRIVEVDAALRADPGRPPALHVDFDFEGATIRYHPTLPRILDGEGHGSIEGWLNNLKLGPVQDASARPAEVQVAVNDDRTMSMVVDDIKARQIVDDATPGLSDFYPVGPGAQGADGERVMRLAGTLTAGRVEPEQGGAIDVAGSSFEIPNVDQPDAPSLTRLRADGTVTAFLSVLNQPPLEVLKTSGLPVDFAEGHAVAEGSLRLPLKDVIRFDEIGYDVSARLTDLRSGQLVPGQMLTADSMLLVGDPTFVSVAGDAKVGDLPAKVTWRQPLGPGAGGGMVTGSGELSQRLVDTFGIGLPDGSVFGTGTADFTLSLPHEGPPVLKARSDLAGVGLAIPSLGWRKPTAGTGRLEAQVTFNAVPRVDSVSVAAAGLTAQGAVTVRPDGNLDAARFSSVKIGNWLDVEAELVGRGSADPDIHVLGGRFAPLESTIPEEGDTGDTGGAGGGSAGKMTAVLDRVKITDSVSLTGFTGDFDMAGGFQGSFSGLVNGGSRIDGTITPQGAKSAFRITSSDAGGVVRSAGMLTYGRGGDMILTLSPTETPSAYTGALKITKTRISGAPAIAALLNAISVVGLFSELAGQGIQFSEVEASFRLTPDMLTIYKSSAVGASIGVSMDGSYDIAADRLDARGVISPIYFLNAIGSVFSRKGEGLIGFNYTMKGKAEDPRVTVNLLSALTPSVLRNVFRDAPRPQPPASEGEENRIETVSPPQELFQGGDR